MFRGMKQVNSNNFSIMIKEILSLRYHPSLETSGMKFSASDFQPKDNPDHLSHIENLILDTIKNEVSGKKISIALSGGVDSATLASIAKKEFD